jgi:hypothetical protein
VGVVLVDSLVSLVSHLLGVVPIEPYELRMPFGEDQEWPDTSDVKHVEG